MILQKVWPIRTLNKEPLPINKAEKIYLFLEILDKWQKMNEGESEDENETEAKYTSEDSESNYKIETEVSDEAEMRDKLNNKIRDFLNKFQSEND